jgi:hypothetical protein
MSGIARLCAKWAYRPRTSELVLQLRFVLSQVRWPTMISPKSEDAPSLAYFDKDAPCLRYPFGRIIVGGRVTTNPDPAFFPLTVCT